MVSLLFDDNTVRDVAFAGELAIGVYDCGTTSLHIIHKICVRL